MVNKYHQLMGKSGTGGKTRVRQATEKMTGGEISYTPEGDGKSWIFTNKTRNDRTAEYTSGEEIKEKLKKGRTITTKDLKDRSNRKKKSKKYLDDKYPKEKKEK